MRAAHPVNQQFVTLSEAAKFCAVSERSIRRLVAAKKLTGYRIMPGSIRIDMEELREYVAGTADTARTRGRHLSCAG
jgi:excisionase family DNA binding protein